MLTYSEFKAERENIEHYLESASRAMAVHPKNEMGMVIEEIRMSDAYKCQRGLYYKYFNLLRALNGKYVKIYAKEMAAERQAEREERAAKYGNVA